MPRTSSVNKLTSPEILIKNVRLLDLDEEFDWPCITEETFSSTSGVQEQQRRSYAAQWLLYKFFLFWDPQWTKTNLHDLFPPLEPKQVGELRLRIYKQLTLLKRDGVFANDLFLRRTMFDECKGPKFEELLAAFSSQVLQHEVCKSDLEVSRVRRMAKGELRLGASQKLPLTLAYQSSFQKALNERKTNERLWKVLGSAIVAKEGDLHSMSAQLEVIISQRQQKRIPKRTLERLRSTVEANWVGDQEWAEITIQSDQHRHQNAFLERRFSEVWSYACKDSLHLIRPKRNDSLLEELRLRVQRQNKRLAKWRTIRASLDSQEESLEEKEKPDEAVGDAPNSQTPPSPQAAETPKAVPQEKLQRSGSFDMSEMDTLAYEHEDETLGEPIVSYGQLYSSPLTQRQLEEDTSEMPSNALADQIIASVANAAPTPMKPPLTIAERTRLSMARLTPGKPLTPIRSMGNGAAVSKQITIDPAAMKSLSPGSPGQYASLVERTRKSMSHMKTGPQGKARKPRVSRISNVYPINQFESPSRAGFGAAESQDTSQLEERLDALASADEELAFRSRPLLAHSPSLGPQPDAIEEDVEEELDELES